MLNLRTASALMLVLASLCGCAGYQTGNGISRLDTITEEDKAESAWYKNYYGKSHCVWGSECGTANGDAAGGGGGGGMWDGGVGPSDSGGSSSSSDSGSSN